MKIIVSNISSQCVIGGSDTQFPDLVKTLREYLRCRPANYSQMLYNMRSHGNKGWDGYTYFLSSKLHFPTGFLPMVLEYMKELGVSITIEDRRENMPEFIDGAYNFDSPKGPLAQHQQELITKTRNYINSINKTHTWNIFFPRGIWDSAPNSRKTATAGNFILNVKNPRVLMLVNDQKLLRQHLEYYKTVFTGKGELGYITSNKEEEGSILTIAMIRTLYNRLKASVTVQRNLHDRYNILIVDECHDFSSKEAVYVCNHINAGIRVGMSGTPLLGSDKVGKFRLIGIFGPVLHKVSKRYLMDNGFSLIPLIRVYHNPTQPKGFNYVQELDRVVLQSIERAELVADIIMRYRSRKVLITFFEHKHGELMYNTFVERYPTLAHLVAWVHGEHSDKLDKIADFISGKIQYLIGSTILQQGINISDIEVLINAQAGKDAIAISQWGGRGERLSGNATHFVVVDIWDDGNYCSKHSRKRMRLYKAEDFPDPIVYKYDARKDGTPVIK